MNITLGQYKGIEIEKINVEVTDDEVNEGLFQLQRDHVKEIDVTDRAVMNGDIVNIDYMGKKDGIAFEGGTRAEESACQFLSAPAVRKIPHR